MAFELLKGAILTSGADEPMGTFSPSSCVTIAAFSASLSLCFFFWMDLIWERDFGARCFFAIVEASSVKKVNAAKASI